MIITELTIELRRAVYERQNGMCAFTGKKFEEFNDSIDVVYFSVNKKSNTTDPNNIVML